MELDSTGNILVLFFFFLCVFTSWQERALQKRKKEELYTHIQLDVPRLVSAPRR